jgi:2-amino-4-hydroxy-6-hydroxymethyldihydropteridine diphosphokinase
MNKAYLLTGGNLGNRSNNLIDASKLVEQYLGKIVRRSSVYRTAAWGFTDQPDFYNQAVEIQTQLSPEQLLEKLLTIEKQMGRKRDVKLGPRIIDIDILLFNNEIIYQPHLTIPHTHLHERRFALTPLAEIAPNIIHPVLHKTIQQLLLECTDTLDVNKIEDNN